MYYRAFFSEDNKITGRSPQVSRMGEGYLITGPNSVWKCVVRHKIEIDLNLDAFKAHYHSKLTDILKTENLIANNLLVSPKMIAVLQKYKLPAYQLFPAKVLYRKKKYDYYLLHFYEYNFEYIDFKKSDFEIYPEVSNIDNIQLNIQTYEDFKREVDNLIERQKAKKPRVSIRSAKLFFKPTNDNAHDLIQFNLRINPGVHISEELKTAIEDARLSGWEFTRSDGLSFREISVGTMKNKKNKTLKGLTWVEE